MEDRKDERAHDHLPKAADPPLAIGKLTHSTSPSTLLTTLSVIVKPSLDLLRERHFTLEDSGDNYPYASKTVDTIRKTVGHSVTGQQGSRTAGLLDASYSDMSELLYR